MELNFYFLPPLVADSASSFYDTKINKKLNIQTRMGANEEFFYIYYPNRT